jgi:hypothetical protein
MYSRACASTVTSKQFEMRGYFHGTVLSAPPVSQEVQTISCPASAILSPFFLRDARGYKSVLYTIGGPLADRTGLDSPAVINHTAADKRRVEPFITVFVCSLTRDQGGHRHLTTD